MTKFFMQWEVNLDALPEDREDLAKLWLMQLDMVKDQMKKGQTVDWGLFAGELCGYSVTGDTTEEELNSILLRYVPFIKFTVKAVMSPDQTIASIKKTLA